MEEGSKPGWGGRLDAGRVGSDKGDALALYRLRNQKQIDVNLAHARRKLVVSEERVKEQYSLAPSICWVGDDAPGRLDLSIEAGNSVYWREGAHETTTCCQGHRPVANSDRSEVTLKVPSQS